MSTSDSQSGEQVRVDAPVSNQSINSTIPSTQFGVFDDRGDIDIATVDWEQVARFESANVGLWILYLHRHQCSEVATLLEFMVIELGVEECRRGHNISRICEPNDMLCILTEILSDPDMFSDDVNAFKNVSYSTDLLGFLAYFSKETVRALYHLETGDPTATVLVNTSNHLLDMITPFCKAMWNNRRLIPMYTPSPDGTYSISEHTHPQASDTFLSASLISVLTMEKMYYIRRGKLVSLSTYAIHFLAYSWTYNHINEGPYSLSTPASLYDMMFADMADITPLIQDLVTAEDHWPQHTVEKISRILRGEFLLDEDAFQMTSWCYYLFGHAYDVISQINSVVLAELMHGVILCCQRQLCSTVPGMANITMRLLSELIMIVMNAGDGVPSADALLEFTTCAESLNLTAICSFALMDGLDRADKKHLKHSLQLLSVLHELAKMSLKNDRPDIISHIIITGARTWHDTLKSILAIQAPKDAKQTEMKREALKAWREYGALFGWRAGHQVTSIASQSSTLSEERRYWKIPKRCFSNACACSESACHKVRVCKGCWRVLYCSQYCQEADWVAGHSLLCKPL